jgi:hypothetical protein
VRRALLALVLVLPAAGAACGSDDAAITETAAGGPEAFGAGPDATVVTTPEGDTVYVDGTIVYGPCDLLRAHKDDLSAWLGLEPPANVLDFGYACSD